MHARTSIRLVWLGMLLSIFLLGLFSTSLPLAASGQPLTFTPAADAYVNSSLPTTNYGTSTQLRTDGSPVVNSYLRFNVTGTGGAPVVSAVLRIYANSSNSIGYDARGVADNTWGETTITYATAPAFGAVVSSSGPFPAGVWTQVDVTSLVAGDGLVSFAITSTSGTAVSYASRESGANAPQLILTLGTLPTATAALAPSSTPTAGLPTSTPTSAALPTATPTTGFATATDTPAPPPAATATPTPAATLPPPTATSTPLPPPPTLTPTPLPPPPTPTPTQTGAPAVVLAAGDIASCGTTGDQATAALLAQYPGAAVLTLGDNAYPYGSDADFANCYNPTWGAFKPGTFPSIGNHEYLTANASGYFNYFGTAAGDPSKGYYSFDYAGWHFLVINSNCSKVGGCNTGNPQETWVRADLAAHPAQCTIAYWHHPRYSSGKNGSFTQMSAIWNDLYNAGAEMVLSGHDHDYERFAPQDANGNLDLTRGIQQFVVGTGGSNHTQFSGAFLPNSLVQNSDTFGVLELALSPGSYSWTFLPVAGKTFTDSGSANCH